MNLVNSLIFPQITRASKVADPNFMFNISRRLHIHPLCHHLQQLCQQTHSPQNVLLVSHFNKTTHECKASNEEKNIFSLGVFRAYMNLKELAFSVKFECKSVLLLENESMTLNSFFFQ